ncbi:aspartate aminotransferase family protein [Paenibacillus lentus]|uniref:Acetylornithine aminotransferase n=1 Tax=Paenibacillus lentus TaxID=1338368 RepID=A0A3Q8S3I7_9BACL|nr:aspartate aminotransferase family protein [Paenibacillus lentus]AZK45093.1 aspartate aminotransferase family protein [Paenibacillus lentus]
MAEPSDDDALFPTYTKYPVSLVKGDGSRLWDDQGKEYLDFMSGIAVCNLGHVSNLFHIPNQQKLAQMLTAHSCADLVFFCNSGAEANEAAIKCARRYHQRVLGNGRYEIITFENSFHGRTMATLTATGQDKVKDGFFPLPEGFAYARYNDIQSVEDIITERTAAIMLELVQGEGGMYAADPEFVARLSALCKERGLLLMIDEVQTGMGRTGKLFAYEHYGIEPDIITLAKGLANGFPIGAMMGKKKLRDAFSPGSHASTFGGAPLAAAAGLATLETILEECLCERAEQMGTYALNRLREQLQYYSIVQSVRGLGLLIGIECREPIAPIIQELLQHGLLVLAAGSHVIRFIPSLYITKEEIDQAVDIVSTVLEKR